MSQLVARAGVQPATFALGVRCSMQLSYRAMLRWGELWDLWQIPI